MYEYGDSGAIHFESPPNKF